MPQNDFLPFATDPSAPVLSQAAYAGSTPAMGRGPGVFPKESYNKIARQGNAMAAAIGAFMLAHGQSALDDGNINGLRDAFAAALIDLVGASATPASYFLASTSGGALSRSVFLRQGTWQFTMQTNCHVEDNGATYNITATQIASLGGLSISTNVNMRRTGGSGYGRANDNGTMTVNTLVVGAGGATVTMSMGAVSLPAGMQSRGTWIKAELIS